MSVTGIVVEWQRKTTNEQCSFCKNTRRLKLRTDKLAKMRIREPFWQQYQDITLGDGLRQTGCCGLQNTNELNSRADMSFTQQSLGGVQNLNNYNLV